MTNHKKENASETESGGAETANGIVGTRYLISQYCVPWYTLHNLDTAVIHNYSSALD